MQTKAFTRLWGAAFVAALLLAFAAAFFCGGCSPVIAKTDLANSISLQARNAQVRLADTATTQPADPLAALEENAALLKGWYAKATMNAFAYAFGDKELLLSAKYYEQLQDQAAKSSQLLQHAKAGSRSVEKQISDVRNEWEWLISWKNALSGKED